MLCCAHLSLTVLLSLCWCTLLVAGGVVEVSFLHADGALPERHAGVPTAGRVDAGGLCRGSAGLQER